MDIATAIAEGFERAVTKLRKEQPPAEPTTPAAAPAVVAAEPAALRGGPVLALALAAGIDEPAKFERLQRLAAIGESALSAARADHDKAAVAFFGAENVGAIEGAKKFSAACEDYDLLTATAERYWAGAPGAERPGQRLTQPAPQAPAGQPAPGTLASPPINAEERYAAVSGQARKGGK